MSKLWWYGMHNKASKVGNIDGLRLQILPTTHSDKYLLLTNLPKSKFTNILMLGTKDTGSLSDRESILPSVQAAAKVVGIKDASRVQSVIWELGEGSIFDFKVSHLKILVHENYRNMWIANVMFNVSKSINEVFQQEISHSPSQLYFFMTKGYVPTSYHIFVDGKFEEHAIPEQDSMAWMYSIIHTAKRRDVNFFPFLVQLQHISMENGKKIYTLQKPNDDSRDAVMTDIEHLMARSSKISYRYNQKI